MRADILTWLEMGLLAGLVTVAFTPLVRRAAAGWGWLARPHARSVHREPVPTAGGVAIFAGFWAAAGAAALAGVDVVRQEGWPLLLASALVLVTGLVDDRYQLAPGWKFLGQLAAAALLVATGTRIEFVTHPAGGMIPLGPWAAAVTVLWLVALTNTMNFLDGLDGLAAGTSAIASLALLAIAAQRDQVGVAFLCAALAGSALGFLPYNFNPARIFMGDTGGQFLGFVLAAIAVEGALKGPAAVAVTTVFLTLGLPLLDGVGAIVRRLLGRRPIYEGDRGHVHHRLLERGFTHRTAVLVLYAVNLAMAVGALLTMELPITLGTAHFALLGGAALAFARYLGVFRPAPLPGPPRANRPL